MASYPNAVVSFTTKNNGDTIQASHINDLQSEVAAIEDGILNGSAPLHSSNAQVNNLNVAGNSTVAGNLTVSGSFSVASLSLTGTLQSSNSTMNALVVSSLLTVNAQPQARVFHGSTQTITNNADVALTFNSEDLNIGSVHSTASNPTRLTVGSTGLWLFGATVVSRAIPVGNVLYLRFRKNGATAIGSYAGAKQEGINAYVTNSVIERMTATTDYMEAMAFQDTAGGIETGNASSRVDQNQFWAVKLF